MLFAGANIRYATAFLSGQLEIQHQHPLRGGAHTAASRFCLKRPDRICIAPKIDLPWMEGRIRPAITWQWAEGAVPYMAGRMADSVVEVLKEHGVHKGAHRHRQLRHAGLRGVSRSRAEHRERLAGGVRRRAW